MKEMTEKFQSVACYQGCELVEYLDWLRETFLPLRLEFAMLVQSQHLLCSLLAHTAQVSCAAQGEGVIYICFSFFHSS